MESHAIVSFKGFSIILLFYLVLTGPQLETFLQQQLLVTLNLQAVWLLFLEKKFCRILFFTSTLLIAVLYVPTPPIFDYGGAPSAL